MTNIDCNELSDVELGAVSGGDFTITVPTPSKETVQKISNVVTAVAVAANPPSAAVAGAVGGYMFAAGVGVGSLLGLDK